MDDVQVYEKVNENGTVEFLAVNPETLDVYKDAISSTDTEGKSKEEVDALIEERFLAHQEFLANSAENQPEEE